MHPANCIRAMNLVALGCLVGSFFLGCSPSSGSGERSASTVASEPRPDAPTRSFPKIEQFFTQRGYLVQNTADGDLPTVWERDQFNTQRMSVISVRSRDQVPGMDANTHFRFTVIVEEFQTPAEARKRFERLFDEPPAKPNSEPNKAFPLRRGFVVGDTVYTLATDVNAFMTELVLLVQGLEKTLL